jgi:uncharacterized membrane protein required for colicin V production
MVKKTWVVASILIARRFYVRRGAAYPLTIARERSNSGDPLFLFFINLKILLK